VNTDTTPTELTAGIEMVAHTEVIGEAADVVVILSSEEPAVPTPVSPEAEFLPIPSAQAPLPEVLNFAPALATESADIITFSPTPTAEVYQPNPIVLLPPGSPSNALEGAEDHPAYQIEALNSTVRHAHHYETVNQRRAA
jgi:hypothetical protein